MLTTHPPPAFAQPDRRGTLTALGVPFPPRCLCTFLCLSLTCPVAGACVLSTPFLIPSPAAAHHRPHLRKGSPQGSSRAVCLLAMEVTAPERKRGPS